MLITTISLIVVFVAIRFWLRRLPRHDDCIDALIEANRAKPRIGMESADWRIIDGAGRDAWLSVRRGQQRIAAQEKRTETRVH